MAVLSYVDRNGRPQTYSGQYMRQALKDALMDNGSTGVALTENGVTIRVSNEKPAPVITSRQVPQERVYTAPGKYELRPSMDPDREIDAPATGGNDDRNID